MIILYMFLIFISYSKIFLSLTEEAQYEEEAQELLERKQQMLNKYRLLLFDDAMVGTPYSYKLKL